MFSGGINVVVIIDFRFELLILFKFVFGKWFLVDDGKDMLFFFVFFLRFGIGGEIFILRFDVVFMIVIFFLGLKNDEFCVY